MGTVTPILPEPQSEEPEFDFVRRPYEPFTITGRIAKVLMAFAKRNTYGIVLEQLVDIAWEMDEAEFIAAEERRMAREVTRHSIWCSGKASASLVQAILDRRMTIN